MNHYTIFRELMNIDNLTNDEIGVYIHLLQKEHMYNCGEPIGAVSYKKSDLTKLSKTLGVSYDDLRGTMMKLAGYGLLSAKASTNGNYVFGLSKEYWKSLRAAISDNQRGIIRLTSSKMTTKMFKKEYKDDNEAEEDAKVAAIQMLKLLLVVPQNMDIVGTWAWSKWLEKSTGFPVEATLYLLFGKRIKVSMVSNENSLEIDQKAIAQAVYKRKAELDRADDSDPLREFIANLEFIQKTQELANYTEALEVWRASGVGCHDIPHSVSKEGEN